LGTLREISPKLITMLTVFEVFNPYMHDGKFLRLDEVLNHYISEIINTET
jgi:cytochrome c peroxidase